MDGGRWADDDDHHDDHEYDNHDHDIMMIMIMEQGRWAQIKI